MNREDIIKAVNEGKSLSGANLYGTNLSGTDLSGANLYGTNLSGTNLYRANLYRANLYRANLSEANLYRANLSEANLYRANLSEANLSGANLYRANLSEANLSEANLSGANLHACMGNLKEVRSAQLDTWPITWTTNKHGKTTLQIGCQKHDLDLWIKSDPRWIEKMDQRASEWWSRNRDIVLQLVAHFPATPHAGE